MNTVDRSEFDTMPTKCFENTNTVGHEECEMVNGCTLVLLTLGLDCKPYIGTKEEARKSYGWLVYNEHVLSGYRINYFSWKCLVKSVCHTHNETANIWTHLLPGVIFMLFIIVGWMCKPGFLLFSSQSLSQKVEEDQANFGLNLTPFTGKFLESFYSKCCSNITLPDKTIEKMMNVNKCLNEAMSSHLKELHLLEESLRQHAKKTLQSSYM
jgi:hypothetical protein